MRGKALLFDFLAAALVIVSVVGPAVAVATVAVWVIDAPLLAVAPVVIGVHVVATLRIGRRFDLPWPPWANRDDARPTPGKHRFFTAR